MSSGVNGTARPAGAFLQTGPGLVGGGLMAAPAARIACAAHKATIGTYVKMRTCRVHPAGQSSTHTAPTCTPPAGRSRRRGRPLAPSLPCASMCASCACLQLLLLLLAQLWRAGSFVAGEMHGFGIMQLANGDTYQGPFARNAFEGEAAALHAAPR